MLPEWIIQNEFHAPTFYYIDIIGCICLWLWGLTLKQVFSDLLFGWIVDVYWY